MIPPFLRFLLVGGTGFIIDAGLTMVFMKCGAPPSLARIPAIGVAMLFTWTANRRLTYQVEAKANIREAVRYFSVAATMALLNYAIYFCLVGLAWRPFPAIVVATAAQTLASFHAYRAFAFRRG